MGEYECKRCGKKFNHLGRFRKHRLRVRPCKVTCEDILVNEEVDTVDGLRDLLKQILVQMGEMKGEITSLNKRMNDVEILAEEYRLPDEEIVDD